MLDNGTKTRINNARDILVGKVPDPKAQVEQITTALIYKFMHDMDQESVELGGTSSFFVEDYAQYDWAKLMDKSLGGHQRLDLYLRALDSMSRNPHLPQLFRDIFKDAFLPYRDPETLNLFLKEINGFVYDHSERLGDAFEYLLSILGSQGAAGQFRTPRHIIDFIVEAVAPSKTDTVLDPACGTAGFLISAFKHILAKNAPDSSVGKSGGKALTPDERAHLTRNFVGYDIAPEMVRLSLVNMYLHHFPQPTIVEYDTLTSEDRWDDSFDVILANPPFMSPKGGIRPHARFAIPSKRSEVLFVDYIAEHLSPNGRAGVIVPEGIIFQSSNAYKALRKMLVDDGYLWAVVSLPAGIFNPYSGVKTSVLLLDKRLAKRAERILFVDVQQDGFGLGAQRRPIDEDDLPRALGLLRAFQANPDLEPESALAHAVPKAKIAADGDYNLSGARYREAVNYQNVKWPLVEMIDIADTFVDGNWIERKDQSFEGIRLIQTGNIGIGEYLDKPDKARFISEDTFARLQCTEVLSGDILISRLPDPVGRSCIVPVLDTRMITAVDCTVVRFDTTKIIPKYFQYLATSEKYFEGLSPYLTGAVRRRISRSNLGLIKIPLPPLDVQRTIVAELDGYQRIIEGARQVIESYTPRLPIDPDWEMVKLGEISTIVRGSSPRPRSDPRYYGGNVPRLMVADVTRDGMYVAPQIDTLTDEGAAKSRPMKKGDLIMAVSGQPGLCSILAIDACIHDGFVGFRELDNTVVMTEFAYHMLMNMRASNDLQSVGAVFRNLNTSQVKKIKIPAPPIETQRELVAQIEREQALVNANRELIEIFQAKIERKIAEIWGG